MSQQDMIFPRLPFNNDRIYTVGQDHTGCKIYIPVHKDNDPKE